MAANDDKAVRWGAGAGAAAVVLFLSGALVTGTPDFGGSSDVAVGYLVDNRTAIQIGSALFAAAVPFLVWFLATVVSLARSGPPGAQRAATVALGCALMAFTLFLSDVAALAVGALRPDNMTANPELAQALLDYSFLAFGMASFLVAGMFVALAVLCLRDGMVWPRWLGWAAAVAAPVTALRIGTLFTTEGPFASDGVLGLYLPVAALAGWVCVASVVLVRRVDTAPVSS